MKDVINRGCWFVRNFLYVCLRLNANKKKKNVNQVLSELTGNPYRDPICIYSSRIKRFQW